MSRKKEKDEPFMYAWFNSYEIVKGANEWRNRKRKHEKKISRC